MYDSLHSQITSSMKKTIASLLQTKKMHIIIKHVNTQLQKGGDVCSLFSIAMTTTLGEKPTDLEYDQRPMCSHLFEAFEMKALLPFSSKKRREEEGKKYLLTAYHSLLYLYIGCQTMGGRLLSAPAVTSGIYHQLNKH